VIKNGEKQNFIRRVFMFELKCLKCGKTAILTARGRCIHINDIARFDDKLKISKDIMIDNCGYDGEILIKCYNCGNTIIDEW
jgi:ribosomal protein S27E